MNGIIINDVTYAVVKDSPGTTCNDCDFQKECMKFSDCLASAIGNCDEYHFKKAEKAPAKNDTQSETSNQSYFY